MWNMARKVVPGNRQRERERERERGDKGSKLGGNTHAIGRWWVKDG